MYVDKTSDASSLLSAAVQKFSDHDRRNFHFDADWVLCYPDGTPVIKLPEGDEVFRLDTYKQQIMKAYQRINLYICIRGELTYCSQSLLLDWY